MKWEALHVLKQICEILPMKIAIMQSGTEQREQTGLLGAVLETFKGMAESSQQKPEEIAPNDHTMRLEHARKWENRNIFYRGFAEYLETQMRRTGLDLTHNADGGLGSFETIDHGGGHDPPWKGMAVPLVRAGNTGARGPTELNSDCSQSELTSCLPTGLEARG
jgi:hypothetical protein